MSVRIGVSFDGFSAFDVALDLARRATGAGAASLWMAEHLGYRQSMVSCTAFVLGTERAMVVPTAISPYLWHPTPVAMAMATLAEAAPGRAAIALGTGNPLFLRESGQEIERPLVAMEEFTECLRRLWTGEAVHFEGKRFRLAGARMAFAAPEPVPIYVAAMGERMLGLAGRVGDGVVLSAGLSTEFSTASIAKSEAGARDAGRDPATLRRAAYIYTSVSDDHREAMEAVRGRLAFLLRNRFMAENVASSGIPIDLDALMDAISRRDFERATALVPIEAVEVFAVAGTPAHCRDRLQAYIDAGIDEPVLAIVGEGKAEELALDLVREFSSGAT